MFADKLNCMSEAFITVFANESLCALEPKGFLFNCLGIIPGVGLAIGII